MFEARRRPVFARRGAGTRGRSDPTPVSGEPGQPLVAVRTGSQKLGIGNPARPADTGNGPPFTDPDPDLRLPPSFHTFTSRALGTDVVALTLAATAVWLMSPTPSPTGVVPAQPWGWSLAFTLVVLGVGAVRGDLRSPMRPEMIEVLRQVVTTTAVAAILTMAARVVLANDSYVAAETLRHWAITLPVLIGLRSSMLWRETRARRDGLRLAPTLIVGAGEVGQRVAQRLLREPEIGLLPVAFLDRAPLAGATLPIHLFDDDLEGLVREQGIRHAVLAFAYGGDATMPDLARRLWELDVSVKVVPRLFELGGERTVLAFLGAMPVAVIPPVRNGGWRMRTKYAIDRVLAAVTLIVISPLLALIAVAVVVSLGRPILFRQSRMGNDRRVFEMLKFRTMHPAQGETPEADADWAGVHLGLVPTEQAAPIPDRTSPLGSLLRRTSLDELPQLLNVLRGDMSLIGPRPERAEYAEAFGKTVRGYSDRQRVRSGLTGWAQVSGLRGKTSLEDRVEWDNHYIEHWSPWLDLKILMLTLPRLMHRVDY
jgi:exopolysaccharide biosynthesis polyprenyl glycosylphosphotransferase